MDSIKKNLPNIVLVLTSLIVIFFLTEAGLRFTPYRSALPYTGMPDYYYEADSALGYDIALNFSTSTHRFADSSYSIWSNNLGCFDFFYGGEDPFVYLGGDSFAWGFSPFKSKWGVVVERELGVRVLKCGIPGQGTLQAYEKAKQVLASTTNPSLMILSYFNNDPSDDQAFPNSFVFNGRLVKNLVGAKSYEEAEVLLPEVIEWSDKYCMLNEPENPTLQRIKCFLSRHSILYTLTKTSVKNILGENFLREVGIVNKPIAKGGLIEEDYSDNFGTLLKFQALSKERNSEFLIVLVPTKEDIYKGEDSLAFIRPFLEAAKIRYLDLTPDFRMAASSSKERLYWNRDGHWNERGNELAGLLVSRFVIESNLILIENGDIVLRKIREALKGEFRVI